MELERSLDAFFRPRSIAVVGASKGTSATGTPKVGAQVFQYLTRHGFRGELYPVNPKETELAGYKCYPSLKEIPYEVDLACLVVPAKACLEVMTECVLKNVQSAIVFSSGFAEAGNVALQNKLVEVAHSGNVRFCGPNTVGMVNTIDHICPSFSMCLEMSLLPTGEIAFITQSGALGGSLLSRAMEQGIGFSYWVSSGNEADLQTSDYVEHLINDARTKVFTLFVEGIKDGQRFRMACRKARRARKPIIVYKTGISDVSVDAVKSHTGALAGSDDTFNGVCKQFGIIRVSNLMELFDIALGFSWQPLPKGNRVGIISTSGGSCGVAADECHLVGLEIPELSGDAKQRISQYVPPFGSIRNPIDLTAQIRSYASGYRDTVECMLEQEYLDGIIFLIAMAAEPRATYYAHEIIEIARGTEKPILLAWTGATSLAHGAHSLLRTHKIPCYSSPGVAIRAMKAMADYRTFLETHGIA